MNDLFNLDEPKNILTRRARSRDLVPLAFVGAAQFAPR